MLTEHSVATEIEATGKKIKGKLSLTIIARLLPVLIMPWVSWFRCRKTGLDLFPRYKRSKPHQKKLKWFASVLSAGGDVVPAENFHLVVHLDLWCELQR